MYNPNPDIENKEIIKRYRKLLRTWNGEKKPGNKELLRKAFNLSVEAHSDMRRKSGEPYVYHPIDVAGIVSEEIGLGTTSMICALLHDVVEDTDYTLKDIETQFGEKIARIIDGLTKIEEIFDHSSSSLQAENFKKILLTLSDDVRVILIKLADRLHNMRTLDAMPKQKQLKIASETTYLYAPLAHRLGLFSIKSELEDLALKYTEPDIYASLSNKMKNTERERKVFIREFAEPLRKNLKEKELDFKIDTETKSLFSIWEKMKRLEIPFEEVSDVFAIRFIIKTNPETEKVDCWRVYSVITDHYRPNVERLRDWISMPRANGYEALHATVMSNKGRWVDVQIRSERMHEIAQKGYVALWKDADSGAGDSGLEEWLSKIREILHTEDISALDFVSDFKMNLFSDEIFVFTPQGELKNLPNGSTALDFAYNIHTQVGNESIGAKVNHKLVPLNYSLKSGDQVEVITSKKQIPKEEWLDFVITARAKSRIKDAIREYRKTFKEKGMEKLKAIFAQLDLEFSGGNIQKLQNKIKIPSQIDLFYQSSQDRINLKDVKAAFPEEEKGWLRYLKRPFKKGQKPLSDSIKEKVMEKPESLVIGGDLADIKFELANCCNPIPGDDIVGFIFDRRPIAVHHTNCPEAIRIMSRHANRMVKAKWRKEESISFLAGLRIAGIDRLGLINKVTQVISHDYNLNIRSFHIESSDGVTQGVIMVYVPNTEALNLLIESLKKIKEVRKVTRIKRLSEPVA